MHPVPMTNNYPGTCEKCSTRVAAGKGHAIRSKGGAWLVRCASCSEAAPSNVVRVVTGPDGLEITPTGYLGGPLFQAYRAAVAGCRFAAERKTQVATPELASAAIGRLEAAGFSVQVSPDAAGAIQAWRAGAAVAVQAATGRMAEIDAALSARGLALFPFQRVGVEWLAPRSGALLADDMGLGKTIQVLAALPAGAPILVVCPAVAKGVWLAEAAKWRPDLRVAVLPGRGSFRYPEAGEMVVTNYDVLPELAPAGAPGGLVIVADEAHALKSGKAQRTVRFRALAQAAARVWLLTATPLLNRPAELWTVLQAAGCAREAFGTWKDFVRLAGGREGAYGIEWSTARMSEEVPARIRRVTLRRMKSDVLADLPSKTRSDLVVDVKATKAQAKAWTELVQYAEGCADDGGPSNLFQVLSGARAALAALKIPAMLAQIEAAEEAGEALVVFSAHRAPIDALADRPGWAVITGDTTPEARAGIQARFQAGDLLGVGATIKAGGVALTLTRAAVALFVDLEWTPALNVQAEDRILRIGQTRPVTITRLVADCALDRRVADLLAAKVALLEASIERVAQTPAETVADVTPAQAERVAADLADMAAAPVVDATGADVPAARRAAQDDVEEWAAAFGALLST